MLKRSLGLEVTAIQTFAKEIINAIACGKYELVAEKVDDMGSFSVDLLSNAVEGHLQINDLDKIDTYGAPCDLTFEEQEAVFEFDDGNGYGYEYQLTTDGDINYLVVQMRFDIVSDTELKAVFDPGLDVQ
jgi:hypothetical protein